MTTDFLESSGSMPYRPINSPRRKLKVICIGAGASGLLVAYKLQRHFDDFELVVYEKNSEISGTWYENRYPGCSCDVPAHIYTYTFEPKPDWSRVFAGSKEISKYFNDFADKYALHKYIKRQHKLIKAEWDADKSVWNVQVEDSSSGKPVIIQDWGHILINCTGILNAWKYPDIPGLDSFKGHKVHSAQWDENLSLKGKSVGLIGNGSSGIQILPAIVDEVSRVTAFYRNTAWVTPFLIGGERESLDFSKDEIEQFTSDPEVHLAMRKDQEDKMNRLFPLFIKDSDEQNMIRELTEEDMISRVPNETLIGQLLPKFSVGCRRLTPGPGYLEALTHPKTKVVFGGIERITETGLQTKDGQEYQFDVLVLATGFDTSFSPRFTILGKNSQSMAEQWKSYPEAYLGLAVSGFPNYFISLGPNCPIGNGSVLVSIEAQVSYMIDILSKFQRENLKSFDVTPEASRDFNNHKDKFMSKTVWLEDCHTWYRGGQDKSKVTALWPGSQLHFLETLSHRSWEDWKFEHIGNRFDYLGDGFSTVEANDLDYAWYISNKDESPIDPSLKRMSKL